MPRKIFKAEMWDKMQYLFRNYYDRMMHCVLFYEGAIDEDALGRALMFQVGEVDVLHSRYHNNFIKPYWVVKPFSLSDFFTVRESEDVRRDAVEFAERRIPIKSNVQIRVGLLKGEKESAVVFVVNHMCFDGGDLYVCCDNNKVRKIDGSNYTVSDYINFSNSVKKFYKYGNYAIAVLNDGTYVMEDNQ